MGLSNWPSQLTWKQFKRRKSRPAGSTLDAYTTAQWGNPPGKRGKYMPFKDKHGWRLKNVNLVLSLVSAQTWVVKGKETTALLGHEQGHWDIAGLGARELHGEIVAIRARSLEDLKKLLEKVSKRLEKKCDRVNKAYDDETAHGHETAKQKKWNKLLGSLKTSRKNLREPGTPKTGHRATPQKRPQRVSRPAR